MRRSVRWILGIAALASAAGFDTNASAQAFDGAALQTVCTDKTSDSPKSAICLAYLRGVVDTIFITETVDDAKSRMCLPKNAAIEPVQARIIVGHYTKEHPEKLSESASMLAFDALTAAFPCEKAP